MTLSAQTLQDVCLLPRWSTLPAKEEKKGEKGEKREKREGGREGGREHKHGDRNGQIRNDKDRDGIENKRKEPRCLGRDGRDSR